MLNNLPDEESYRLMNFKILNESQRCVKTIHPILDLKQRKKHIERAFFKVSVYLKLFFL